MGRAGRRSAMWVVTECGWLVWNCSPWNMKRIVIGCSNWSQLMQVHPKLWNAIQYSFIHIFRVMHLNYYNSARSLHVLICCSIVCLMCCVLAGVQCQRPFCHIYWGCNRIGCQGCLARFSGTYQPRGDLHCLSYCCIEEFDLERNFWLIIVHNNSSNFQKETSVTHVLNNSTNQG